jgi:hypothetical protein
VKALAASEISSVRIIYTGQGDGGPIRWWSQALNVQGWRAWLGDSLLKQVNDFTGMLLEKYHNVEKFCGAGTITIGVADGSVRVDHSERGQAEPLRSRLRIVGVPEQNTTCKEAHAAAA